MAATKTNRLIFMALSIAINFIGCTIALVLRLPIYLDSIGTLLSGVLLGPLCGAVTGCLTSMINGITVDPVSLYFIPVQIVTGLCAGFFFQKKFFDGLRSVCFILLTAVLISLTSAVIVTLVFNGVTSSGSSLIVAALNNLGINKIFSVFSTQIVTDILDKAVSFALVFSIIRVLPESYQQKIVH